METIIDNTLNKIASKHLGKEGSYAVYSERFDSSFLVPMPRKLAREQYNIVGNEFVGFDVWHCHESTFLLNCGLPIAGTLKICYSSSSEFIVESKSIKLYVNSFDMCKIGETINEATKNYTEQVKLDLENVLKTKVEVFFHEDHSIPNNVLLDYKNLYDYIDPVSQQISITDYYYKENHLSFKKEVEDKEYKFYTNILRSRCRHTKQKDTGNAFIYLKTNKSSVSPVSLLKQIIALREVNEFHEFCCERLYIDLMKTGLVKECCVTLLYARRGSWDINPVRSSSVNLIDSNLINVRKYTLKQQNQ